MATPPAVADALVRLTLEGWQVDRAQPPVIVDPACGEGALLLAAARALASAGIDPGVVVDRCLVGIELDARDAASCRAALTSWARSEGARTVRPRVQVADALLADRAALPPRVDVVVANPPYLAQRTAASASGPERRAALRERFGGAVTATTDEAALFALLCGRLVARGGRVGLLVPASVLAAEGAAAVREDLAAAAALRSVWSLPPGSFDAAVQVVGLVLAPGAPATPVELLGGSRASVVGRSAPLPAPRWSEALAAIGGVPGVGTPEGDPLGTVAEITAGFRDQYYGLRGHVRDAPAAAPGATAGDEARLVTVGALDHLGLAPDRPVRFDGRRWRAPVVDLGSLVAEDPALAAWGRRRLVPKVVLAPQGAVPRPAVDEGGRWWPSVPLLSVLPRATGGGASERDAGERLWRLAAALWAPPAAAWAAIVAAGTARAASSLPLPTDPDRWHEAAAVLRAGAADGRGREALAAAGPLLAEAHGLPRDHPCVPWWLDAAGLT